MRIHIIYLRFARLIYWINQLLIAWIVFIFWLVFHWRVVFLLQVLYNFFIVNILLTPINLIGSQIFNFLHNFEGSIMINQAMSQSITLLENKIDINIPKDFLFKFLNKLNFLFLIKGWLFIVILVSRNEMSIILFEIICHF